MRRFLGAALLLLSPASAYAGAFGLLGTGGLHTEQVYFHSSVSTLSDTPFNNINDYELFRNNQILGQFGGGAEVLLGDARDDKVTGSIRIFYNADLPQQDPSQRLGGAIRAFDDASNIDSLNPDDIVVAYRPTVRHLGFAMVGLNFAIAGDPNKLQLLGVTHVGAAFLTLDHTEFFMAQAGPGIAYRLNRQSQFFADAQYQLRFRKTVTHAASVTAGFRYLFD